MTYGDLMRYHNEAYQHESFDACSASRSPLCGKIESNLRMDCCIHASQQSQTDTHQVGLALINTAVVAARASTWYRYSNELVGTGVDALVS